MRRSCHLLAILAGCGFDAGSSSTGPSLPPASPSGGSVSAAPAPVDPTAGETVELKLELADGSAALATLGLTDSTATTTQDIWFYDTDALALFDAGVILRARKVHDGDDDATVKARPMLPEQTAPGWLALAGSKCEVDETLADAASSCSSTSTPSTGVIDDVAGGQPIANLFDADQLVFLGSLDPVELTTLARLGPIPSTVWTLAVASLPAPLSLERWVLVDGTTLLEASFRVAHADAPAGMTALQAWASADGLVLAADQSDKTGVALQALTN